MVFFGSGSCHDYKKKTDNDINGSLTWALGCKVVATGNHKGNCRNVIPDIFDSLFFRCAIYAIWGFFHEFPLLYRKILPLVMQSIEKVFSSEYTRTYWKVIMNS